MENMKSFYLSTKIWIFVEKSALVTFIFVMEILLYLSFNAWHILFK